MKRLISALIAILFCLAWPGILMASPGNCSPSLADVADANGNLSFRVLTFSCVFGTGADATATLTSSITSEDAEKIKGWYLLLGTTYNNATAPTALYDIYLKETDTLLAVTVDILGSAGTNRPGTAGVSSQLVPVTDTTYATGGPRAVLNTLTMTASGNAVEGGGFVAQFVFGR